MQHTWTKDYQENYDLINWNSPKGHIIMSQDNESNNDPIYQAYLELKEAINSGFKNREDGSHLPHERDKATLIALKRLLFPAHKGLYGTFEGEFKNFTDYLNEREAAYKDHCTDLGNDKDKIANHPDTFRLFRMYNVAYHRRELFLKIFVPLEQIYKDISRLELFQPNDPYYIDFEKRDDNEAYQKKLEEYETSRGEKPDESKARTDNGVEDATKDDDTIAVLSSEPKKGEMLEIKKEEKPPVKNKLAFDSAKDNNVDDVESDVVEVDPNAPFRVETGEGTTLQETT